MKTRLFKVLSSLGIILATGLTTGAQYVYTTLDDPLTIGTMPTYPQGIQGTTIVGYYEGNSPVIAQAFVYRNGNYTTLHVPWASADTYAQGISGSNIVGYFMDTGYHGFLYNGSTWTKLCSSSRFSGREVS